MLDICIRNGDVIDGTGKEAEHKDIGISDGKIVAIGCLKEIPSEQTIDASGKTVCPGFLDMHRHADAAIFQNEYGSCDLSQGITTIGNGNCGLSLVPQYGTYTDQTAAYLRPVTGDYSGIAVESLTAYRNALKEHHPAVNALMLAGGGTIRATVAGFQKTRLDDSDFERIHRLLEKTLSEGAGGISLGLGYAPECFYTTEELIRALEPVRGSRTVVSVHLREEAMRLLPSIEEMLTVAAELHVPLQVSHLKACGKENWNRLAQEALNRLAQAREEGIDVCCDVYAYTAGSTQLIHILPPEALKGGTEAITARLTNPAERERLLKRLASDLDFDNYSKLVGWDNILISSVRNDEDFRYEGKSIAEACGDRDPAEFTFDLLARNRCEVTMIDFITTESDIAEILKSPFSYVISDSTFPTGGKLHPRVYGAFSTVIEIYVKERKDLTLPEAIHKMTKLPAERYGLTRKGEIAVGKDADILVFDPDKVHVKATYEIPDRPSEGMNCVIVNGKVAVLDGKLTGVRAGRVLEGNS